MRKRSGKFFFLFFSFFFKPLDFSENRPEFPLFFGLSQIYKNLRKHLKTLLIFQFSTSILGLLVHCDAPNPAPDVGVTIRDCDSLTFYFSSFRSDTCIHIHNFCNNKNSFYIYIIHTTIVTFIIFYTHILESLYLYYYNFTNTKLYI